MTTCAIVPDLLNTWECEKIIETYSTSIDTGTIIKSGNSESIRNLDYRKSKILFLDEQASNDAWLFDKIYTKMRNMNEQYWNFDLDGAHEPLQFTSYEQGEFYDWHMDTGHGKMADTEN